jgi:hypothetical protein
MNQALYAHMNNKRKMKKKLKKKKEFQHSDGRSSGCMQGLSKPGVLFECISHIPITSSLPSTNKPCMK